MAGEKKTATETKKVTTKPQGEKAKVRKAVFPEEPTHIMQRVKQIVAEMRKDATEVAESMRKLGETKEPLVALPAEKHKKLIKELEALSNTCEEEMKKKE